MPECILSANFLGWAFALVVECTADNHKESNPILAHSHSMDIQGIFPNIDSMSHCVDCLELIVVELNIY